MTSDCSNLDDTGCNNGWSYAGRWHRRRGWRDDRQSEWNCPWNLFLSHLAPLLKQFTFPLSLGFPVQFSVSLLRSFDSLSPFAFLPSLIFRTSLLEAQMHLLTLSTLAALACASNVDQIFKRQDLGIVRPGNTVYDCPKSNLCGGYCRRSNEFCCPDLCKRDQFSIYYDWSLSDPCQEGQFCLGGNICCFGVSYPKVSLPSWPQR